MWLPTLSEGLPSDHARTCVPGTRTRNLLPLWLQADETSHSLCSCLAGGPWALTRVRGRQRDGRLVMLTALEFPNSRTKQTPTVAGRPIRSRPHGRVQSQSTTGCSSHRQVQTLCDDKISSTACILGLARLKKIRARSATASGSCGPLRSGDRWSRVTLRRSARGLRKLESFQTL